VWVAQHLAMMERIAGAFPLDMVRNGTVGAPWALGLADS
jgi:hypothetical protein